MKQWTEHNISLISPHIDQLNRELSTTYALQGIKRGLEKESLRITPQGTIAQSPHPTQLGSPLTHPNITTDYSEALLEFITPPCNDSNDAIAFLKNLHTMTYQSLKNEQLWVNSMPCLMNDEASIPIAQYGSSNSAKMKSIYRVGLGHRYGRFMQTIAGTHYNFSLPKQFWVSYQQTLKDKGPLQTFIDDQYFRLIRNFQRYSWVPVYLFGASPMVCQSYLTASRSHRKCGAIPSELVEFLPKKQKGTLFLPQGTSLRMSSLGYHNSAQADLHISYNSLSEYTDSLESAIRSPSANYEKIGLYQDGAQIQLSANILQIENEFYNAIRPKRTSDNGERPTVALRKGGVEYIEVRLLDLDPSTPGGIHPNTLDFMDIFLLFCLLSDSPALCVKEQSVLQKNLQAVVTRGRNLETPLIFNHENNTALTISDYFNAIFPILEPIADFLDSCSHTTRFSSALHREREKTKAPELTPSHRIIESVSSYKSFFEYAMEQSETQRQYFLNQTISLADQRNFEQIASDSILKQKEIEQDDQISLEQYISNYFQND